MKLIDAEELFIAIRDKEDDISKAKDRAAGSWKTYYEGVADGLLLAKGLIAEEETIEIYQKSDALYKNLEAALREQEERRWIPVTERLPGNDDFVLVSVCGKAGCITLENATELAQFSMDEGWILEMWPELEDPKVTHWMPLPEPPKEVGRLEIPH